MQKQLTAKKQAPALPARDRSKHFSPRRTRRKDKVYEQDLCTPLMNPGLHSRARHSMNRHSLLLSCFSPASFAVNAC